MAQFSEINIAFRVYENAVDYYGIADVDLPDITQITEEMQGAGFAGKYDAVIIGHIEAMKTTINFRNPTKIAYNLFTPVEHQLDLRANVQERDTKTGGGKAHTQVHAHHSQDRKACELLDRRYQRGICGALFRYFHRRRKDP